MIVLEIHYRQKHYKAYCDGDNIRIAKQCHRIHAQTRRPVDYEHTLCNPHSPDYMTLRKRARERIGNMNET